MPNSWKPEIEKKYRLGNPEVSSDIGARAENLGFILTSWSVQKDWIPDSSDFAMRNDGVLLRIRSSTYMTGSGASWLITLKRKSVVDGVHINSELEASSLEQNNMEGIATYLEGYFGKHIDLERLAALDLSYAALCGLTEQRMYMEKRRQEYRGNNIPAILAIDELPKPAGWFAELEVEKQEMLAEWESRLALSHLAVETRDYGEIVKQLTSNLPVDQQRRLSFT